MRVFPWLLYVLPSVGVASAGSIFDDAPYQTPAFAANVTHRTNLCARQQLLRTGDLAFLDVLRGLELSAIFPVLPGNLGYLNYDEERGAFAEYPGYHIELLDELASLAGFSWRESYATIDPYGYHNRSIDDMLEWAVNTYDFSFFEYESLIDRMQRGINFPRGFSDASTILIARHQSASSFDVFNFMNPFDSYVWLSILATVVFSGLMYRWVHKASRTESSARSDDKDKPAAGDNIFRAALTATGQLDFSPVTHGEKILVFSLAFWSMIITATYTANLASVMISKVQPVYPATSMAEAEQKGVTVCVIKDWAVAAKLKQNYPDAKIVELEGVTTLYEHLLAGDDCDLVADSASRFDVRQVNQTLNADCSLRWVGRAVDISAAGPANVVDAGVHCTSLVGHVFEYYLTQMQLSGFTQGAYERYLGSVSTHACPAEDFASADADEAVKLTMRDMGGIFVVHGVFCVVGLLATLFQRRIRRQNV